MTQSDLDTSNDMSYEDLCAIAWKGFNAGKGARKKGPGQVRGIVDKELMSGRVTEEVTEARKEARKGSMGSKLDWYGDKDKGGTGNKGEGKKQRQERNPILLRLRRARASRNELCIQMDQQH